MEDCLFCNIDEWRIIYKDKYFYSIFDGNPVSPGHALIISKRHVLSILDLDKDEWTCLHDALKKVIDIIQHTEKKELYELLLTKYINEKSKIFCENMLQSKNLHQKPDGYNIGNNDGEAAGRTIHHLHIQVIPRYKGDVPNPAGGIRHVIPGKGNYKD